MDEVVVFRFLAVGWLREIGSGGGLRESGRAGQAKSSLANSKNLNGSISQPERHNVILIIDAYSEILLPNFRRVVSVQLFENGVKS
jgi:hypothetical protein